MTGCSAPMCSNHSRNGFKFYRFPADPGRRNIWLENCRRGNWTPTQNNRLCSAHFEDCQIEQNRADGKKRLLPFAVPTVFNILTPNLGAPRRCRKDTTTIDISHLQSKIVHLEEELQFQIKAIAKLEQTWILKNEALAKFLTPDQMTKLQLKRKYIKT